MSFKEVFNFKKRVAELISMFKNIKTFDFLGRLKTLTNDIPAIVGLAGGTLMFIGSFLPFATIFGESLGISMAYNFGWAIFVLSMAILGLTYFKQPFWAGLTAALCFTVTFIQGITLAAYRYIHAGVGFWFILLGELAVMGALALHYFVFNKKAETPVIEATTVETKEATTDAE